ncbi:MAG TPA: hypothetical protein VF614_15605 [Chthoniobacteraceae bacterium]|jgi:hypothetical protein
MKIIAAAAALALLSIIVARAEETLSFKTLDGRTITNATVSKIEPSGLQLMTDDGIERVPFTMLSPELQTRFGYDPEKAKVHERQSLQAHAAYMQRTNMEAIQLDRQKTATLMHDAAIKNAEAALKSVKVRAVVVPSSFEKDSFTANITPVESAAGFAEGKRYFVVIEGQLPPEVAGGDLLQMELYLIGNTGGSARWNKFTRDQNRAVQYLAGLVPNATR